MFVRSHIGRILLLAVAVLLVWAFFAGESGAGGPERSYRVKPGDTLWSIAESIAPAEDPREVIGDITRLNLLRGGELQIGQELAIPAQYSK